MYQQAIRCLPHSEHASENAGTAGEEMRGYIGSLGRALRVTNPHHAVRVPRSMRPRVTRSTYVPVSEASVLHGLSRAAF